MAYSDILTASFKVENERDWEVYQEFLHAKISWELFAREEKMIKSIHNYMKVMKRHMKILKFNFSVKIC